MTIFLMCSICSNLAMISSFSLRLTSSIFIEMSDQANEVTHTEQVIENNDVNQDEDLVEKEPYVQPVYEISATDHINKSLLGTYVHTINR
ncbi:hypothetical protein PPL_11080 [Heterostelium album PN500]|uniref:Uncharacterized protein n=1 Tax=Heterostelium pallidum (strain ATCC 26659 / Pp 5 / PN500) TaxID=670386 RepID=D3BSW0_HETP5|nr:hypothetical protein PPL_11080 [Heterostelium album PN500]EFA75575.1 hypothetical protein PPL_11080 [Heterostelium album PN500]|eukprot:XP_020427709.1 hypothetical protein PPL_11080 [Heterostelium album PN500]